jgi:hypothetical protein
MHGKELEIMAKQQHTKQLSTSNALIGFTMLLRASFIHVGISEQVVCPDVVVEWLEFSLYIVKVPGSNLSQEVRAFL